MDNLDRTTSSNPTVSEPGVEYQSFDWAPEDHRDLRSTKKATNRARKQQQKYYGYRGVKPTWEGQPYYTLSLVSTESVSNDKQKKRGRNATPPTTTEHDEAGLLSSLVDPGGFWYRFAIPSYVELALSEARGRKSSSRSTRDTLPDVPLPNLLEMLKTEAPDVLTPDNLTLRLKVSTWTKENTFAEKEYNIWPLDVRHHRGKRRVREKHLEKWELKHIGRSGKQLQNRAESIKEETADFRPATTAPVDLDTSTSTQTRFNKSATESHKADALADLTAQRIDKYYKENIARVNSQPKSEAAINRNYERNFARLKDRAFNSPDAYTDACCDAYADACADAYADACCDAYADACTDAMADEMVQEERKKAGNEEERAGMADETSNPDDCETNGTAGGCGDDTRSWGDILAGVNAEAEVEPGFSSDIIIVRHPDDGATDSEFDTMSDAAEAIVSLEWEVLSDTSTTADASEA